jgi:hypothetical protein
MMTTDGDRHTSIKEVGTERQHVVAFPEATPANVPSDCYLSFGERQLISLMNGGASGPAVTG